MPPAYTPAQRSAIAQFVSFTSSKDSVAARHLKAHGWNVEQAVDAAMDRGLGEELQSSGGRSVQKSDVKSMGSQNYWALGKPLKETMLYQASAILEKKLSGIPLGARGTTMRDLDEEENTKLLLQDADMSLIRRDLRGLLRDYEIPELGSAKGQDLHNGIIKNAIRNLVTKAHKEESWIDPIKLPSMFRFVLRRPLWPESKLRLLLHRMNIDDRLSFLGGANPDQVYPRSYNRSQHILRSLPMAYELKTHVSSRHRYDFPPGLSLLEDSTPPSDDSYELYSNDSYDSYSAIMAKRNLWEVFRKVELGIIDLKDACNRYKEPLLLPDATNEELADELHGYGLPSDHINRSFHTANLWKNGDGYHGIKDPSKRAISDRHSASHNQSDRQNPFIRLVDEVAGIINIYRLGELLLPEAFECLEKRLVPYGIEDVEIMRHLHDRCSDSVKAARLLLEARCPSISDLEGQTEDQGEDLRGPQNLSEDKKELNEEEREIAEFQRIYDDFRDGEVNANTALALFRETLGDSKMSDRVLSKHLQAYGIPPDMFLMVEEDPDKSHEYEGTSSKSNPKEITPQLVADDATTGSYSGEERSSSDARSQIHEIYTRVKMGEILLDSAAALFRAALGDSEMSDTLLSRNLTAYGIPFDLFLAFTEHGEAEAEPKNKQSHANQEKAHPASGHSKPTPESSRRPSKIKDKRFIDLTDVDCGSSRGMNPPDTPPAQLRPDKASNEGSKSGGNPVNRDATISSASTDNRSDQQDRMKRGGEDLESKKRKRIKREELSCHHCGKKYQNQRSLEKHIWEHHALWNLAGAGQGSKHEKVETLEAASILRYMSQGEGISANDLNSTNTVFSKASRMDELSDKNISASPTESSDDPAVIEGCSSSSSIESQSSMDPQGPEIPKSPMPAPLLPKSKDAAPRLCKHITSALPVRPGTPKSNHKEAEWRKLVSGTAGYPLEEIYNDSDLSSSPEQGISSDLFGLRMPTSKAKDLALSLKIPSSFVEERIRSDTPQRTSTKKFKKLSTTITLPKPKRKAATAFPASQEQPTKILKDDVEPSYFAREGQDSESFVKSLITPGLIVRSTIRCPRCFRCSCQCQMNDELARLRKKSRSFSAEPDILPTRSFSAGYPARHDNNFFENVDHFQCLNDEIHDRPPTAGSALVAASNPAVVGASSANIDSGGTADAAKPIFDNYHAFLKPNVDKTSDRLPVPSSANFETLPKITSTALDRDALAILEKNPVEVSSLQLLPSTPEIESGRDPALPAKILSPTAAYVSPIQSQRAMKLISDVHADAYISPYQQRRLVEKMASLSPPTLDEVNQALAAKSAVTPTQPALIPPATPRQQDLESVAWSPGDASIEWTPSARLHLRRGVSPPDSRTRFSSPPNRRSNESETPVTPTPSSIANPPTSPYSPLSYYDHNSLSLGSSSKHQLLPIESSKPSAVDSNPTNGPAHDFEPKLSALERKTFGPRNMYKKRRRRSRGPSGPSYAEVYEKEIENAALHENKSRYFKLTQLREKRAKANLVASKSRYFQSIGPSGGSKHSSALDKLFDKYRDEPQGNPDTIGVEGSMKYLGELGVNLDEVAMFAVLTVLSAPTMGELTRGGFVDGWKDYSAGADTLAKQKSAVTQIRHDLATSPDFFKRVYKQTFLIARVPGQKNVQLDAALEYWRLLFTEPGIAWSSRTSPWLEWWIEFLETKWRKAVGKDMWDQTGSFARKSLEDESLEWWSEDGAWPGVIDDFVIFVKEKRNEADQMDVE